MRRFFWRFRYLPELLESLIGLVTVIIYEWGLSPLPYTIQIRDQVVPLRFIMLALIVFCVALFHGSLHRWLVNWLRRKGWSDPHHINDA